VKFFRYPGNPPDLLRLLGGMPRFWNVDRFAFTPLFLAGTDSRSAASRIELFTRGSSQSRIPVQLRAVHRLAFRGV